LTRQHFSRIDALKGAFAGVFRALRTITRATNATIERSEQRMTVNDLKLLRVLEARNSIRRRD